MGRSILFFMFLSIQLGGQIRLFEEHYRVDENIKNKVYYHAQKSCSNGFTIKGIGQRIEQYFPIIEPILKKYNIPDDFKYLAVAESALANVSSSKGASGVWQIMPQTGRELGLRIGGGLDERTNIVLSTYAACKYLRDSYKLFKNWTLVAASYNCGRGCILREIKENKTRDYFKLQLNNETSDYIYRILSCKILLEIEQTTPTNKSIIFNKNSIRIEKNNLPLCLELVSTGTSLDSISKDVVENYSEIEQQKVGEIKLKSVGGNDVSDKLVFKIQPNKYIMASTRLIKAFASEDSLRYYIKIEGIEIDKKYENYHIKIIDEDREDGLNKMNMFQQRYIPPNTILNAIVYKI